MSVKPRAANLPAPPAPGQRGTPAPWSGLAAEAARAGVLLTADQLARFATYRRLLIAWNARFNLTAITDPVEIERRLFLDALLMLPTIDSLAEGGRAERGRLIDIGSGAGFPGLPLKIARPDLDVTLVEATRKKASFLAQAIAELGLTGVVTVPARAEDLARDPAHRAAYDLATARAVASLPALLELSAPFLRLGGHAVFPKGLAIDDELAAGERAAPLLGVRIVGAAPLPDAATRLVVVAKTRPTPDRFPRRPGLPSREPLGVVANPQPGGKAADSSPRRSRSALEAQHSALSTQHPSLAPRGRAAP